ncbi:head-tail joining protein [Pseudomonas sp. Marseille-QA0332]
MAGLSSFRERMAQRLDRPILKRVGDRATRADGREVLGIFENPFRDPQLGAKGGSQALAMGINAEAVREPRFSLPAVDAAGLDKKGAILTIELPAADGGGRYEVIRPEPDGSGWVALVLGIAHERTADIF